MSAYAPLRSIRVREGFNVRGVLPNVEKLADDIAERGQLEPISVRTYKPPSTLSFTRYTREDVEIVSGHRRYAALCFLRDQKREALSRFGIFPEGRRHLVDDDFPVAIHVVEMTDEDALLANLAENAHSEGMRQVDVVLRAQRLLQEGASKDRIVRALGISEQTLDARLSAVRRLAPPILDLWKQIARPEHEPPWHLLHDVARGGAKRGRGGVHPPPAVASEQLKVWKKFYGEGGTTKLSAPTWREPHRMRSVREIRMKEKELRVAGKTEQADALLWALGKDVVV